MKILAIDPGNKQSAYVMLEDLRIVSFDILPNVEMLAFVERHANLDTGDVQRVAIEMIQSFGMAVGAEVFETVFWIGQFYHASRVPAHRVNRMEVKMHLCKHPRAKDANIRQALIDKLGPQGTKKEPGPTYGVSRDVWSALAVGVTWLETKASAVAS